MISGLKDEPFPATWGKLMVWYWFPVLAYASLIFYLSSQSYMPDEFSSVFESIGDKGIHLVEYGVLGVLCYRAFRYAGGVWTAKYAFILAVVTAAVYGLTDEVHQAFVPLREADRWDVVADALGAGLGTTVWYWIQESLFPEREDVVAS